MIELTFTYLSNGETYLASVVTNGTVASVQEVLDEDGNVPESLDWDIISELELFALCLWQDEQATYYLSAEVH